MKTFHGKPLSSGIAIGKVSIFKKEDKKIDKIHIKDSKSEYERVIKAKEIVKGKLIGLQANIENNKSDSYHILEGQKAILEDPEFLKDIKEVIEEEKVKGEYALNKVSTCYYNKFLDMKDPFMKERGKDILDISQQILSELNHPSSFGPHNDTNPNDPIIILAQDLLPSEIMKLYNEKVAGIVLNSGSYYSHTSIIAKTMGIPTLIQTLVPVDEEFGNLKGIIDGNTGTFYIEPSPDMLKSMELRKKKELIELKQLEEYKFIDPSPNENSMKIYGNANNEYDVHMVKEKSGQGIGLLRSEFIYMERDRLPSEDELFDIYKAIAEEMENKPVIIRTLDIGSDKQLPYIKIEEEKNPQLGYRGIRVSLDQLDIFKTQIRAILRASYYGNLKILYPMITSLEEVNNIKELINNIKNELDHEKIKYKNIPQGIMIETPAAVIISDLLAKEVDFFSIGTNDLTQFTLATDRQNEKLEKLFDPQHPAILRMIEMVKKNAYKEGISVGICGDFATNLGYTKTFLKMGINDLSVPPSHILKLKKRISDINSL